MRIESSTPFLIAIGAVKRWDGSSQYDYGESSGSSEDKNPVMAPFRMRVQRAAMPSFEFYEPSSDEAEVGRAFERVFINYGSMFLAWARGGHTSVF